MKPYNPQKFVPDMCKIAYNLTLKHQSDLANFSLAKYVLYSSMTPLNSIYD